MLSNYPKAGLCSWLYPMGEKSFTVLSLIFSVSSVFSVIVFGVSGLRCPRNKFSPESPAGGRGLRGDRIVLGYQTNGIRVSGQWY